MMKKNRLHFIDPIDGDMFHTRDGVMGEQGMLVQVSVKAPGGHAVRINGMPAAEQGGVFRAGVLLRDYRSLIEALDETTGEMKCIFVYFLPSFAGKYRVSIDDNIWWLRDLHQQDAVYQSLFDNPYLGFLKEVHDTWGTKVHLNIFYQTEGFNLSQLSDRFRPEWRGNADWLRLSFHAMGEFPDKPYQHADYARVKEDCELVMKEIRRFAGEELMGPVTTLHWGEANVQGSRALRDSGYLGQLGYFNVDDELPAVSYYLSEEERRHMKKRWVWRDNREGIVFIRSSMVVDKTDLDRIEPHMDAYASGAGKPPYVDFLVHEQYYYPDYSAYQPDYAERIRRCVQWADRNGYTPGFLEDCLFEKK